MLADPMTLRNAATSAVFDLVSTIGSKTIRQQVSGLQTNQQAGTLTISHDQNASTKRKRSMVRFDANFTDAALGNAEVAAVYLVIDRVYPSLADPSANIVKAMLGQLMAIFATDPTAASPGSIPYGISTTNGTKLFSGEP
jgi:hypothetical protein